MLCSRDDQSVAGILLTTVLGSALLAWNLARAGPKDSARYEVKGKSRIEPSRTMLVEKPHYSDFIFTKKKKKV